MGGWSGSRLALRPRGGCAGVIAALAFALLATPAGAAEKVKMSTFQSNFCCFPGYVAQHLKLFEKHGVEVELVYGTGIQVANILISGSTDFGAFAIEHGVAVTSMGQDVKLLVVTLTRPPFSVIVRNEVPTPNVGKPYPQMLADLKGLKIGISTPGASTDVTLRFLLREAGLDPQKDVTIVPVGDPTTALAGLKNGLIDGNMSVEPTQTAAVTGLKIAKHVLNIENGEGPELFRDFAYNGVFARGSTLKERPQAARAVVAAIVEAEQRIQDPNQLDEIVKVAQAYMRGIDADLLRAYLQSYRRNFSPVATPAAIRNISQMLLAGKLSHSRSRGRRWWRKISCRASFLSCRIIDRGRVGYGRAPHRGRCRRQRRQRARPPPRDLRPARSSAGFSRTLATGGRDRAGRCVLDQHAGADRAGALAPARERRPRERRGGDDLRGPGRIRHLLGAWNHLRTSARGLAGSGTTCWRRWCWPSTASRGSRSRR
jgi:ABC-type nitrate/sulfonate/bicarbonate transport system substrate-binding protein